MARSTRMSNETRSDIASTAAIGGVALASGAGGISICPVDNQTWYCKFMRVINVVKGIFFLLMIIAFVVSAIFVIRWFISKKK